MCTFSVSSAREERLCRLVYEFKSKIKSNICICALIIYYIHLNVMTIWQYHLGRIKKTWFWMCVRWDYFVKPYAVMIHIGNIGLQATSWTVLAYWKSLIISHLSYHYKTIFIWRSFRNVWTYMNGIHFFRLVNEYNVIECILGIICNCKLLDCWPMGRINENKMGIIGKIKKNCWKE